MLGCWVYLSTRRWTIGKEVKVWFADTPKHELIASRVQTLTEQGVSIDSIARQIRTSWMTVKAADFARAGGVSPNKLVTEKPVSKNGRRRPEEVDLEVVRLRDQEGWSFVKIAKELAIGNTTASRAYDRGRGTTNGEPHKRARFVFVEGGIRVDRDDASEGLLDKGDRGAQTERRAGGGLLGGKPSPAAFDNRAINRRSGSYPRRGSW